jgi:hypothetical protein
MEEEFFYGKTVIVRRDCLPQVWGPERQSHRSLGVASGYLPALRRLRQNVDLTRVITLTQFGGPLTDL